MQSVCFTGACPDMTRAELTEKAEEKFEVKSSVTKDLDILVCADPNSGSSKLEKAKKNGTKVISYGEFLEMLDSDDDDDEDEEYFELDFDEETLKKIFDKVRENTKTDIATLSFDPKLCSITQSKLGGYPYWTKDKEFPKSEDGECNLVLLAQINFAEMPHLKNFPDSGILQFFHAPYPLYGLHDGKFRAVYHEKIEEPLSIEELKEMGVKTHEDYRGDFPVKREAAFYFHNTSSQSISTLCAGRFEHEIFKAICDLKLPVPSDFSEDDCDSEMLEEMDESDAFEEYRESCDFFDSKINGYPAFCQEDPRREDDGLDVLLLQIAEDDYIVDWGDGGVANYFISREDLKKRDFSKVLFNYDCY